MHIDGCALVARRPLVTHSVPFDDLANVIRALSMDAVEKAKSGHPGMPMGMADVACVLFREYLKHDPSSPHWPDRDRFILSAGHGSMLLYSALYLSGYEDVTLDDLKNFRQLHSPTAGHPEFGEAGGIEMTTGPLGQGLATAVGFAMAERLDTARYGAEISDHYTYVIAGDGCLMEGVSHEAISMAGHLKLGKLIVLFDDNSISIDGSTDLAVSDDQAQRFAACGWHTQAIDGHDPEAIRKAVDAAKSDPRPSMIACKTEIGRGAPTKAGKASSHGSPLGAEEIAGAREALGWAHAPFDVPGDVLDAWRADCARGEADRLAWEDRLASLPDDTKDLFLASREGVLSADLEGAVSTYKQHLADTAPKWATRKSSQEALEVLTLADTTMIGGSADLTGSNNTRTKATDVITPDDFSGRYIHYGVREFGMAAAMNGIALHGGYIPYGGTFLVFSDYNRPAIRLAAIMNQRVIHVGTHDSIGLGEDGPTHQPVEHLSSLRAMPNLNVYRPADAMETLECWQLALARDNGPSVLSLTRQGLPALRLAADAENRCAAGAYVIQEVEGERDATLIATGSEVHLCVEVAKLMAEDGLSVAVVSMPCQEEFAMQSASIQEAVLGSAPRFSVEAGATWGWERWTGSSERCFGLDRFGASAPGDVLFEHFGFTAENLKGWVVSHLG